MTLHNDSEIGSYKIPYFECNDCFVKKPINEKYKVGESTPIEIKFINKGFKDANIIVFYDNEIFKNWFKLRDGQPSWSGLLKPNQYSNIVYSFEPLIAEEFIISPAIMKYVYNGYIFNVPSNPVIVGATPYFDSIACQIIVSKRDLRVNENTAVQTILYNDSNNTKEFELYLSHKDNAQKKEILLNPFESKNIYFELTSDKESTVNFTVSLQKTDLNKICGIDAIGFTDNTYDYKPILIILLLLIAVATFVYYNYFL
jgi:hypothetical protein